MSVKDIILVVFALDNGWPDNMALGDEIEITVPQTEPFFIGRMRDVDLLVAAPSVGRRVVRLERRADGLWIDDLGSGAGSALEIDGQRLVRPHSRLPNGATLWIGGVCFRVQIKNEP